MQQQSIPVRKLYKIDGAYAIPQGFEETKVQEILDLQEKHDYKYDIYISGDDQTLYTRTKFSYGEN